MVASPRALICPSAEPRWYSRLSYAFYTGSHFPTLPASDGQLHPLVMKMSRLAAAGRAPRAWDKGPIPGGIPVLWGDRCNVYEDGNNGGPLETNHMDMCSIWRCGTGRRKWKSCHACAVATNTG